ncbi:MAG: hypothetical protein ACREXS_05880 [Gammaproteobacteria bacterium]
MDLSAFYHGFKPLEIALQVRNVFDETYVEGADRKNFAQFRRADSRALQR